MTRIGRSQIKTRQTYCKCFLAARQSRPAQIFFRPNRVDQYHCVNVARLYPNNV